MMHKFKNKSLNYDNNDRLATTITISYIADKYFEHVKYKKMWFIEISYHFFIAQPNKIDTYGTNNSWKYFLGKSVFLFGLFSLPQMWLA